MTCDFANLYREKNVLGKSWTIDSGQKKNPTIRKHSHGSISDMSCVTYFVTEKIIHDSLDSDNNNMTLSAMPKQY